MKINQHLFLAAATIYQTIVESDYVKTPQDPFFAVYAHELATMVWTACRQDPNFTMAATRALCGFMKNKSSAHATKEELVNLSLIGANNLVEAFSHGYAKTPLPAATFSNPMPAIPARAPQMPPPVVAPEPPPPPQAVPQAEAIIPDFQ